MVAGSFAMTLKILFFSQLQLALEKTRSSAEVEGILQQLFSSIRTALKSDATLLDFPDINFYNIMIIRKKYCDLI